MPTPHSATIALLAGSTLSAIGYPVGWIELAEHPTGPQYVIRLLPDWLQFLLIGFIGNKPPTTLANRAAAHGRYPASTGSRGPARWFKNG